MTKTIKDINIKNKKVIIRCDFNVPINEGKIVDDTRIRASLDTIKYALSQNAKIILLSHLGRIKEESDLEKNDLQVVATRLSELLNREVKFINQTRGKELEKIVDNMKVQDIVMIQNTRYEDLDGKKESTNDLELGKYWASLADVFINDAFGTIHRAHASNVGVASNLESAIGFLVEKELTALQELDNPQYPYVVILGGAKVSDKIGVINNLVTKADYILIGGGMAFTFLKAKGYEVGKSLVDSENINYCQKVLKSYPNKIILPIDIKTAPEISNDAKVSIKKVNDISIEDIGLDIGPQTITFFESYLKDAQVVVWNGPMGVYEITSFKKGTDSILTFLADNNIKTIVGGGDTAAAVSHNHNLKDKIYHISTGGGATLEYLEGKKLPGLEAIN